MQGPPVVNKAINLDNFVANKKSIKRGTILKKENEL